MRLFCVVVAALMALITLGDDAVAQEPPHDDPRSPDRRYTVEILESALPGSDPNIGFFTIVIRKGHHILSKFPTEGYLTEEFWSPDGKYVAVNNRRGNSGDYLWVFRLSDGHAIKKPDDAEETLQQTVQRVTAVYPDLTFNRFHKLFTFAKGWMGSGRLQAKTNMAFQNLDDQIVAVWETYTIKADKLVLVERRIEKAPWPPPKP